MILLELLLILQRFRPLDGESISKRSSYQILQQHRLQGFRPLDGESISKLSSEIWKAQSELYRFRPLDGESISKRKENADSASV